MDKKVLENLTVLGWCPRCEQYVEGISSFAWGLPKHSNHAGEACLNAGNSAKHLKYRIDSPEQAQELAQVILEDKRENCLYGAYHSIACGDGRNCEDERIRRAQALAQYVLDSAKVKA